MKLLLLASVFGILSALLSPGKGSSVGHLNFIRGNVRSLVMALPCPEERMDCSFNVRWEYKTSIEEPWKNISTFGKHLHLHSVYFLKDLLPEKLYYIRAFVSPPGDYTHVKEAWTCPNLPPPVTELRLASAGPGWLDVRWRRPKENCRSTLIFLVRYNVEGLPLGAPKTYGIFDSHAGYAGTHPLHPCPDQDTEFCVYFTDRVHPGRNHTVEVRTTRYDIDDNASAEPQKIIVFADAKVIDSQNPEDGKGDPRREEKCAGKEKKHTDQAKEITEHAIAVPLWILVIAVVMVIIAFLLPVFCLLNSVRNDVSGSSNTMYTPINVDQISPIMSMSVTNIYDYPQLPQGKPNSTLL